MNGEQTSTLYQRSSSYRETELPHKIEASAPIALGKYQLTSRGRQVEPFEGIKPVIIHWDRVLKAYHSLLPLHIAEKMS
jgi:hypothetical protein